MLMLIVVVVAGCSSAQRPLEETQPQEVLGTMVIGFSPVAPASLPEPPIDLMLHIKPTTGKREVIYNIADGNALWELFPLTGEAREVGTSFQNFALMLSPGDYEVGGLDVRAKTLSDKPFFLPTGGPRFTVPDGNCVYIGRIGVMYSRLPPGPLDQAAAGAGALSAAAGRPLIMIYLPKGALLPVSDSLDEPAEDGHTAAAAYSRQLLAYAQRRKCAVQLATFQARAQTD